MHLLLPANVPASGTALFRNLDPCCWLMMGYVGIEHWYVGIEHWYAGIEH